MKEASMKPPLPNSSVTKDAWWAFKDDRYRLAAFFIHELRVGTVWIVWISAAASAGGVVWRFFPGW